MSVLCLKVVFNCFLGVVQIYSFGLSFQIISFGALYLDGFVCCSGVPTSVVCLRFQQRYIAFSWMKLFFCFVLVYVDFIYISHYIMILEGLSKNRTWEKICKLCFMVVL